MTDIQKKYIYLAGLFLFLLLSGLVFWYAGKPLIRFASEPEQFRRWMDARGASGRLAFLGMVILQIFVAVIPGEPLEIAAGYAFGFWEGTFLCILGMTIGGILVFSFVRKFGTAAVEVFFSRERIQSLKILQNNKRLTFFVALIFLIPGTPKDLLSYAVGLTPIRLSHWLLITSICRIPSVITSTMGGSALGSGELPEALIVFAITGCISLAGFLLYRKLNRNKN